MSLRSAASARQCSPVPLAVRAVVVGLVATASAWAALLAWGASTHDVGPLDTRLSVVLAPRGGVEVSVPPLGKLRLPTHAGPLHVRAEVTGVDPARARALLRTRNPTRAVVAQLTEDSERALLLAALRSVVVALGVSALMLALTFRSSRTVLAGTGGVLALLVVGSVVAWSTLRTEAINEPTFTGLLAQAPALVGRVEDLDAYGDRVAQLTANVSRVYSNLGTLPTTPVASSTRLLWVSDIHNNPQSFPLMRQLARQFEVAAILDSGDIVDVGSSVENAPLRAISTFGVPYVYSRGNHDSRSVTQAFVAAQRGARVLEPGQVVEVGGVRIAGAPDPLFRPNKASKADKDANAAALSAAGDRLSAAVRADPMPVDVAMVHEPAMASALVGAVPLVLSGHTHERRSELTEGTLRLTQGSSGGAGLRTYDTGDALPLQMSVLHFDGTGRFLAVDDVTVGGLGQSSVTVERQSADSYGVSDDAPRVDRAGKP